MNMINSVSSRFLTILAFLLLFVIIIAAVYAASTIGTVRTENSLQLVPADAQLSGTVNSVGDTLVMPLVDSDIIAYLRAGQPDYQALPLDALDADIPPIGAYISRPVGQAQESALPTPLPYATSPPLADSTPGADQNPSSTNSNAADIVPDTLPYLVPDGIACAPEGYPIAGTLSQRFHLYHQGIDIIAPIGTPVRATHSGQITYAGWNDIGYGYLVIVQSGPYITYYGHSTSFNVVVGQWVGKGSIIAWSGTTGNSTGPHIHYETRIDDIPVDPLTFSNRGFPSC